MIFRDMSTGTLVDVRRCDFNSDRAFYDYIMQLQGRVPLPTMGSHIMPSWVDALMYESTNVS